MLKLHGVAVSNYYNMIKQSLLEKGIPFQEITCPPSQQPAFLTISPMGKIPCLETDDGFISESLAIIEYLEETRPKPALMPDSPYARAKMREIMCIAELYLDSPARRHLGHVIFGEPLSKHAYDTVRPQVVRGLAALTRVEQCAPWIAGHAFSYADIVVMHVLRLVLPLMDAVYHWDPLQEVPTLAAWLARVTAREHSQTVISAQQQALTAMQANHSSPSSEDPA
ncbi:glutathione S-transferase family protein [Zobellella maritima]|uniref:glutathione S-transferase family protein n=1 Tax=Zobellella maritima TaxID=2059725 RepID=UPI000E301F4E|nr:glutathione S-transferase family protein [Zobellella maritima]